MPVTPSFGAYAKTPDLAGAYLGAQRNAIARENIVADAAASAARIQLGREQLAAAAVQNAMELEAKKEIYAKQAMQRSQEAEIEKAYRETQFGLKERELQNDEAITAMRIQEAARGFDANQDFNRVYQSELASGKSEGDAQRTAARAAGPNMQGFGNAIGGGEKTGNATERSLLYRSLSDEEKQIRGNKSKYNPQYTPEELRKLEDIQRRKQAMFEPPSAALQQQFQVDPNSIPAGAPTNPNWSSYMGPPQFGQALPNVPMMQTNTPSLRILNVRRK